MVVVLNLSGDVPKVVLVNSKSYYCGTLPRIMNWRSGPGKLSGETRTARTVAPEIVGKPQEKLRLF
jgi:hypothetical protein